jgi:hypothetical protein
VLATAAARRTETQSLTATLIADVFVGRDARPLPATVLQALEQLDAAYPSGTRDASAA